MNKDEALKLAMEWYDSGHEIREEYEAMIKTILAQPEQKPVAYVTDNYSRDGVNDEISAYLPVGTKLYTSPPKRKPLTDEEIDEIYFKSSLEVDNRCEDIYEFTRAIEAAHGIKGEA